MRLYQQAFLGLFLVGVAPLQAQNLYVFSVIETSNSKRPDRLLDADLLDKLTNDIARYGNYTKHWYDFGDSTAFNPETIRLTLDNLKPQAENNDIIWLHYAGRGYSNGPQAWPTLQVNGGDISLRELLAVLRSKPVRTLLVTVDCGNKPRQMTSLLGDTSRANVTSNGRLPSTALIAQITHTAQADIPDMTVVSSYRRLFKAEKVRQIIIMASASHDQAAYSDLQRGSVWLTALDNSIAETICEQPVGPIWKHVQEKIVRSTQKRTRNRQTPLYNRQTITCCENEVSY